MPNDADPATDVTREPIALSWSGGKDSAMALGELLRDPLVRVVALVTTVTRGYDRVSIHGVRRSLLHAQARAIGIPLVEAELEPRCSNADYDAAMEKAFDEIRARHPDLRRVAYGDLFLEDVRRYREERLAALGLEGIFPLWSRPTDALARTCIASGIETRLVCLDTTQLDARFAGRAYDAALLDELPPTVDPCGERGEFHTFVSNAPMFGTPVRYDIGESVLRDDRFLFTDLIPRNG
jgi:uncharacterized protein (TIGR00290 family)